jgi:vacuolar-type H+-ATPase subunit I/STV1
VFASVPRSHPQRNEHALSCLRRSALVQQLQELGRERNKLNLEKAELENTLEAEQEFIANRLQMQV